MRRKKSAINSLTVTIILLILLPFLIVAFKYARQYLIRAAGTTADITVDAAFKLEPLKPSWNSFAQGGEESVDMIAPVVNEVRNLQPRYIRIDHLYDHFNVVDRNAAGQLTFDFSRLDMMVNSIRKTGALPFFSLSYMPQIIAENGDIIGKPKNWDEWALVVQRTIEHYSGRNGFNLSNVYYEVWNEPDLFGSWKYGGDKNYLTLYTYAVTGANRTQNTNQFKIGGPATTQLYKSWVKAVADHVTKNKLRLDFISWHRYNLDPTQYAKDVTDVTNWLFDFPELVTKPWIISEWGFDPEINGGYDSNFAAAHAAATVRQALYGYDQLLAFELVDGPDPAGKIFWGRWGLITHPKTGTKIKPRYQAFQILNQIHGNRLLLTGEGTWVTGIAAIDGPTIKILLINFDSKNQHVEQTPLTVNNLNNGKYNLKRQRLGQSPTSQVLEITNNRWQTPVIMLQNSLTLIELTPQASISGDQDTGG